MAMPTRELLLFECADLCVRNAERHESRAGSVLDAAGARSWNIFDREMTGLWTLREKQGVYTISVQKLQEKLGWHEDETKAVHFPPGTDTGAVIDHLVSMIQARALEADADIC